MVLLHFLKLPRVPPAPGGTPGAAVQRSYTLLPGRAGLGWLLALVWLDVVGFSLDSTLIWLDFGWISNGFRLLALIY